jgi:hypothetical protein
LPWRHRLTSEFANLATDCFAASALQEGDPITPGTVLLVTAEVFNRHHLFVITFVGLTRWHGFAAEFASLRRDLIASLALHQFGTVTPVTTVQAITETLGDIFLVTLVRLPRWHGFATEFASLRRDLIASLALHQFGTVTPVTIVQSITESLGLGVFAGSRAVAAGTAVVTLLGVALVAAAAVDKPAPIAPVAIRFAVAEATGITLVRLARGH